MRSGQDITSHISQGSLAGLLNVRNTVLPSLQGDGQQQGALNQLAQQVADRVNSILTSAQTAGGAAGSPLFTYGAAQPGGHRADAGARSEHHGRYACSGESGTTGGLKRRRAAVGGTRQLDRPGRPDFRPNHSPVLEQHGDPSGPKRFGRTNRQQSARAVTGAIAILQTQVSGVSLDAEAAQVLQLQQGYQAAGKMVSVINALSDALLNMV